MGVRKETRDKLLIADRVMYGKTPAELAREYGISQQRVHQILFAYGITESREGTLDALANRLYNYIITYKMNNDGQAPNMKQIVENSMNTSSRAIRAIERLVERGLIRYDKSFRPHRIYVVGAEWLPPEDWEGLELLNE
jgi:DNA-binding MarR family transcriptional regulator